MSVMTYLEQYHGVRFQRVGSNYKCCCPIHSERTPSFYAYPDGHGHCYSGSCACSYDVVELIYRLEFGGQGSKREAFAKAIQLGFYEDNPEFVHTPIEIERPFPSPVQVQTMTIAFNAYHEFFLDAQAGRPGRVYLNRTRGIRGDFQSAVASSIGFAPYSPKYHLEVVDRLRREFGDLWWDNAMSCGIITAGGRQRLRSRVIFACHGEQGVEFYQGRSVLDDAEAEARGVYKHLNAPGIRKAIFEPLAQGSAAYPGTFCEEGPMDALAYAVNGFHSVGLFGSHIPKVAVIRRWRQPLVDGLDMDGGDITKAGPKASLKLRERCVESGLPIPLKAPTPVALKDSANWLKTIGPKTFTQINQGVIQQCVA